MISHKSGEFPVLNFLPMSPGVATKRTMLYPITSNITRAMKK
jgi:hypothetical protein